MMKGCGSVVPIRSSLVLCLALSTIVGCATIIRGTEEEVRIETIPEGATATIEPGGLVIQTPASVALQRANEYIVTLELEEYETETVRLRHSSSGVVFGNLILGGLIGYSTDQSSGAVYNLIPNPLVVELVPAGIEKAAIEETAIFNQSVRVVFYNASGWIHWEPIRVQINESENVSLKRKQYWETNLSPGSHEITLEHDDIVTFRNSYELLIPDVPQLFIKVQSKASSTVFEIDGGEASRSIDEYSEVKSR